MGIKDLLLGIGAGLCLLLHPAVALLNSTHHPWSALLLKNLILNGSSLSITSLHFHSRNKAPAWVDHLMGSKSVFWRMTKETHTRSILNFADDGRKFVLDQVSLLPMAATPSCSFEILGLGKVGSDAPFTLANKHNTPSAGYGELLLPEGMVWRCYYRATYDNWRSAERAARKRAPSYWPTFIYCPAPYRVTNPDASCHRLLRHFVDEKSVMKARLQLFLANTTWPVDFAITLNPREIHARHHSKSRSALEVAVCSAFPYLSSNPAKREGINAIFFEWVRYYTNLDIRLVVYDATATQRSALINSAYSRRQQLNAATQKRMLSRMEYYDYTLLSRLFPPMKNIQYDNSEMSRKNISILDDDHTYTLTHCRFDVQARLGIHRILVADFDEFLYCPAAEATAQAQATFLKEYLAVVEQHGLDQLLLFQHGVLNRTTLRPRDCVAKEASGLEPSASIFNCFAAHAFPKYNYIHKSLHVTKACPFNTDHHACTVDASLRVEDYDCMCDTRLSNQCTLIHLSHRDGDAGSSDQDETIRQTPSELLSIVRSEPVTWKRHAPITV